MQSTDDITYNIIDVAQSHRMQWNNKQMSACNCKREEHPSYMVAYYNAKCGTVFDFYHSQELCVPSGYNIPRYTIDCTTKNSAESAFRTKMRRIWFVMCVYVNTSEKSDTRRRESGTTVIGALTSSVTLGPLLSSAITPTATAASRQRTSPDFMVQKYICETRNSGERS